MNMQKGNYLWLVVLLSLLIGVGIGSYITHEFRADPQEEVKTEVVYREKVVVKTDTFYKALEKIEYVLVDRVVPEVRGTTGGEVSTVTLDIGPSIEPLPAREVLIKVEREKRFVKDDLYTVSLYEEDPKSLNEIRSSIVFHEPEPRFSLGVSAGVGIVGDLSLQPFVGLGLNYRLIKLR